METSPGKQVANFKIVAFSQTKAPSSDIIVTLVVSSLCGGDPKENHRRRFKGKSIIIHAKRHIFN